MIEVALHEVSKTYNPGLFKKKVRAVHKLSFEVMRGEVLGLIGPNGAGKSTTIRLLLGLIRPDSGTILFRGKSLKEANIHREIGYLPENPYLYDHLTLQELLVFCGQASGIESLRAKRRGNELMEKLNLFHARNRPLRTFSKGMLQRAGICFALLHDPPMIILDEPMSGLDPIGRKMVFDLVLELKQQGKTVFFCSHILSDVERLCDRIGLMTNGSLVRRFSRDDFLQGNGSSIHLVTSELSESQQQEIQPLVDNFCSEGRGHLLAVSSARYYEVNECLQRFGVEVLSCRSEWASLEDLFMEVVMEQGK
ncbi:MAG: ABC transporter ATP-binding protein [Pedobacter sp.]